MESESKVTTQCDSCKTPISTAKPKKDEPPNEAIQATLNTGMLGVTKDYHFCDEECLRTFLNSRAKKNKSKANILELEIPYPQKSV
jgi:YHS domain-containing protein